MNRILSLLAALLLSATAARAAPGAWQFDLLDGGTLDLAGHEGPALVVNTASLCAFTPQYDALQELHETYGDQGLLVLAVPSDDFRQELDSAEEVRDFCEINFDLTLPITQILPVRGTAAHPFFADMERDYDAAPRWNFTKYLVRDGTLLASWGSAVRPGARAITRAIEAALP